MPVTTKPISIRLTAEERAWVDQERERTGEAPSAIVKRVFLAGRIALDQGHAGAHHAQALHEIRARAASALGD